MIVDPDNCASAEMPRYKCHKEVWALKIALIVHDNSVSTSYQGGATIMPADEGYGPFRVDADYITRHRPEAGGYYVVYKDGYKSFSPADAFEDGYARI